MAWLESWVQYNFKKGPHSTFYLATIELYFGYSYNEIFKGGFDLHEQTGAAEMVDRILNMLSQYLVSNQTLKLDKTFKLYLKILSIDSMKFKNYNSNKRKIKRTPNFYLNRKKRIGARTKAIKKFNYHWALDVPNSFPKASQNNVFEDKCILTSCILGLLQNNYFKSNKSDKRYHKAQYINSTLNTQKNIAGKIIFEELIKMLALTSLPASGPYELHQTAKILSETYKCQIIVFDGISNSKKSVLCILQSIMMS